MAAINKNFVIKNGLEVDTNLILADPQTNKVGIGTTVPQYTLHVNGGIGVTNVYVSGITTVINELRVGTGGSIFSVIAGPTGFGQSVGVGTARPAFLLDIRSPVSTGQTALFVQGDIRVTGDLNVDDISITNLNVSGVSTFVGFATFNNNILVAGISTFVGFATFRNNILVAGISTFVGFATFQDYVFIQDGLNVTGTGATLASLNVLGVSTFVGFTTFNSNILVAGIGTVTTLNSTSGTITNLVSTSGTITNLVSTSGTITNLTGTSATITTFNSTTGNITNLTNTNLNVTGIATIGTLNATGIGVTNFTVFNNLSVGGISTFTNGPVLIGSGTSTGTASQKLQVTGGTYVSGNLGIGSTNPTSALFVVGDARVTGVITATTFIGSLTGTASSTTNIPNLTGAIISVNTTTSLGSFSSSNLSTALTDKTGTGVAVFATSPTLVTPILGAASASSIVVGSGVTINVSGIIVSAGIITATTFVGALTGTASNVTTNANLTGHVTSVGNAAVLGSFTSLQLLTALTDKTGTGVAVFATSPTLVTPVLGSASASSINVSGISTLGTVKISSGIITATSGIVTYFGDGSYLTGTASNPNLQTVLNTGNTSSTGFNITGVSTLTTLNSTNGTITNLTGTAGTITTFNSTNGTITNLTGTAGTITNISGTNLNYSGIGTITNISGTNVNLSGVITSTSYVISGGTSSQFLKADGSVDSTSYTSTGKAIAIAIVFGG